MVVRLDSNSLVYNLTKSAQRYPRSAPVTKGRECLGQAPCVRLLGFGKRLEPFGNVFEALFAGSLCHARVHGLVLFGFTMNGRRKVLIGRADRLISSWIAYLLDVIKMAVRVSG